MMLRYFPLLRADRWRIIMPTPDHDYLNDPDAPIPWMQQLLDSPFILLILGVMIPMIVYNLWGVIEILLLPVTQ